MNRNSNLDLIKCIACLAVLMLHTIGMINYTIYYLAGCGVPLFFMVNGYLMFSKEKVSYSYAGKKAVRLARVIFLWNLLILIPVALFRHKLVNPLSQCMKSVMQQGYLWHFWFFGGMIVLYLLLPVLRMVFDHHRTGHILCCIALAFTCMYIDFLSAHRGYAMLLYVPQALRIWMWLFFYLTGGLIARIQIEKPQKICFEKRKLVFLGVLVIVFGILNNVVIKKMGLYLVHTRIADVFYGNVTSIIWYSSLFLFLLKLPLGQKIKGVIGKGSSLSLGIFILHPVLMVAVNSVFTPVNTFQALLYMGIVLFLAAAGTIVLKKIPGGKWLISV